jgi:hypothetical protein
MRSAISASTWARTSSSLISMPERRASRAIR